MPDAAKVEVTTQAGREPDRRPPRRIRPGRSQGRVHDMNRARTGRLRDSRRQRRPSSTLNPGFCRFPWRMRCSTAPLPRRGIAFDPSYSPACEWPRHFLFLEVGAHRQHRQSPEESGRNDAGLVADDEFLHRQPSSVIDSRVDRSDDGRDDIVSHTEQHQFGSFRIVLNVELTIMTMIPPAQRFSAIRAPRATVSHDRRASRGGARARRASPFP